MAHTHAVNGANNTQAATTGAAKPKLEKLFIRAEEVAEMIGMERSFVFDWARKGLIPSVKLGNARRFPYAEILAWKARLCREQGVEVEG